MLSGVGAFLGLLGLPFNFDHGPYMNTRTPRETAMMCLNGAIRGLWIALPFLCLEHFAALAIVVCGGLSSFGYLAGNKYREMVKFTIMIRDKVFLSPSEGLEEIIAGASYGLGAYITFMLLMGARWL